MPGHQISLIIVTCWIRRPQAPQYVLILTILQILVNLTHLHLHQTHHRPGDILMLKIAQQFSSLYFEVNTDTELCKSIFSLSRPIPVIRCLDFCVAIEQKVAWRELVYILGPFLHPPQNSVTPRSWLKTTDLL